MTSVSHYQKNEIFVYKGVCVCVCVCEDVLCFLPIILWGVKVSHKSFATLFYQTREAKMWLVLQKGFFPPKKEELAFSCSPLSLPPYYVVD